VVNHQAQIVETEILLKIQLIIHQLVGSNQTQIGGHHRNQRKPKGHMKMNRCSEYQL
jgi:hypothetical protein